MCYYNLAGHKVGAKYIYTRGTHVHHLLRRPSVTHVRVDMYFLSHFFKNVSVAFACLGMRPLRFGDVHQVLQIYDML